MEPRPSADGAADGDHDDDASDDERLERERRLQRLADSLILRSAEQEVEKEEMESFLEAAQIEVAVLGTQLDTQLQREQSVLLQREAAASPTGLPLFSACPFTSTLGAVGLFVLVALL